MTKFSRVILFCFLPLLSVSQPKTPFVSYDFKSDTLYQKKLIDFKSKEDEQSTNILKSIAEWSYHYKDWETAIDHYEKLVVLAPLAENYFMLGVAAARRSLEVSRFFSVPYVVKARKYVLQAHELQPQKLTYLNLLIQLYAEIPPFLGGSIDLAKKKLNELMVLAPLEGMMMQAYLYGVNRDFDAAASKYMEVFRHLEKTYVDHQDIFLDLKRNFIFDLGRSAAVFKIKSDIALAALNHYIHNYSFTDNYPLEWAYYYLSKIYFYDNQFNEAQVSIKKALEIKPDFDEGIKFLNQFKLE
jgi:tetratricopeptide (TPR) repeat protein